MNEVSYFAEQFDYANVTEEQRSEIGQVYAHAFEQDIGLIFDATLDSDFLHPEDYYVSSVGGAFFVVYEETETSKRIVGTTGLRKLDPGSIPNNCFSSTGLPTDTRACELKRMFILPCARGKGLAHQLLNIALRFSREHGYNTIFLDTKKKLQAANNLYEKHGFLDCDNYNGNPRADRFMRKQL